MKKNTLWKIMKFPALIVFSSMFILSIVDSILVLLDFNRFGHPYIDIIVCAIAVIMFGGMDFLFIKEIYMEYFGVKT